MIPNSVGGCYKLFTNHESTKDEKNSAKKEVKERRKGRKKKCFTGSSFECDFFFF
jgi:hypothetical protein